MDRVVLNNAPRAVTFEQLGPFEDVLGDKSMERLGWPAAVIVISAFALVSWSLVGGLFSILF